MGKALEISRSIREGKWLSIEYDSKSEQRITYFWARVIDVFVKPNVRLKVQMFNSELSMTVMDNVLLYYDAILDARVIEGTTCEIQSALIKKITSDYQAYAFLEYLGVNERVLAYYLECSKHDKEASIRQFKLVEGLDDDILQGNEYRLNDKNLKEMIQSLKLQIKEDKNDTNQHLVKLAVNLLAIQTSRGLFPIAYRDLLFNVEKRTLLAAPYISYNLKLKDKQDNPCFNLSRYYDGDVRQFMTQYETNREALIENLQTNLKKGERLNEMPYVFRFEKTFAINLKDEYSKISAAYQDNRLSEPARVFFGMSANKRRYHANPIMAVDSKVNMDQYRTIYNAMNQTITYVQGPPGTGKTSTIVNVVLSSLLNRQKVLIVSNNNEAINNIYRKLSSFMRQGELIQIPMLRLGANAYIEKALQAAHGLLFSYFDKPFDKAMKQRLTQAEQAVIEHFAVIRDQLRAYEEAIQNREQRESLQEVLTKLNSNAEADEVSKAMMSAGIKAQMANIPAANVSSHLAPLQVDSAIVYEYLYLRSLECINHLYKKGNQALFAILKREEKEVRMLEFKKYISSKDGLKSLLDCFPIIISTNMSALKLGSCEPQFDLMIMDEASQCSNPYALLPMVRSKRALFVGDQNQLQPVIVMDGVKNSLLLDAYDIPPQYDYKSNSILSTMLKVDPLSTFILLRDHYRSHDKIIDFSNKKYYGSELHLCSHRSNPEPLKLIDIDSSLTNEKNTSVQEAEAIINEIRKGESQDVAVITPFRKQADLLERQLNEAGLDFVKVGTIHTFQGDEKQKIIVSSAVTKNTKPSTFNWLKNNQELINVAVTRARENLVLVTDMRQLHELSQHETNDFIELADYIAKDGKLEVSYKENEIFNSKVKNFKYYNTACEEEFLGTLMHLKTVFGQLQVAVKVKVSDVLDLDSVSKKLFIYGNQAHFDFVVYDMMKKPLLAIEVMGLEHFSEIKVRERDERKQEICRQCNLKLISIHNDYVRRYQYIKNIILNTLKSS